MAIKLDLDFHWNMSKDDWERMLYDHTKHFENGNNYYGSVYCGKLCMEFDHTMDESAWYLYTNVFEIEKDTGYGYTVTDGVPYDLLDSYIIVPVECESFDDFKKEVEKRFEQMVKDDGLEEQATHAYVEWH